MAIDGYQNLEPFRFWCQTVLPTVYDESLSYYELLNKLVSYVNVLRDNVDLLNTNVDELNEAFNTLQEFVDNYFENLDVQQEINDKLNAMALDGSLSELLTPIVETLIPGAVDSWLVDNFNPQTVIPLDASLTLAQAAAQAKAVGDLFDKTPYQRGVLASGSLFSVEGNAIYGLSGDNTYTDYPDWMGSSDSDHRGYLLSVAISSTSQMLFLINRNYGYAYAFKYISDGFPTWTPWHNGTDTTLSKANMPADARAIGLIVAAIDAILYGGNDKTDRIPWVSNAYSPTIEAGQTFDVRNMPRDSFIYKAASELSQVPVSDASSLMVRRLPITATGNVSLYIASNVSTRQLYAGYYTETNNITWRKILTGDTDIGAVFAAHPLDKTVQHVGTSLTDSGWYFSDTRLIDGAYKKLIDDFPFAAGWLLTTNNTTSASSCLHIAFPNNVYESPAYRIRISTNEWSDWLPTNPFSGSVGDRLKSDYTTDDWILTEFETTTGWYKVDGSRSATGTTTTLIPVTPGRPLYGMWFGGTPAQEVGGGFFDIRNRWISAIKFPTTWAHNKTYTANKSYVIYSGSYYKCIVTHTVGENDDFDPAKWQATDPTVDLGGTVLLEPYDQPNVTIGDTYLTYAQLWKIIVPDNAQYIVLNLRTTGTAATKDCQSISTMPIIGVTGTGNRTWRQDDPMRARKKGKTLYIIGQSGVSIDRAYRTIYNASTGESEGAHVIVGWQEYVRPYYDSDKVVTLGFQGIGYRYDPNTSDPSIYHYIDEGDYIGANIHDLSDADDVYLNIGVNNVTLTNGTNTMGTYTDTDPITLFGALNSLIDLIYTKTTGHPVRIYIETYTIRYPADDSRRDFYVVLNEQIRLLAAYRGLILVDLAADLGFNSANYPYYTYDSNTSSPPYGGHSNNAGNELRGYRIIDALLS